MDIKSVKADQFELDIPVNHQYFGQKDQAYEINSKKERILR